MDYLSNELGGMKVKSTVNNTIEVRKAINLGHLPLFVSIIHKHFEKEIPEVIQAAVEGEKRAELSAPVDLLRISISNEDLLNDVAEITFSYHSY